MYYTSYTKLINPYYYSWNLPFKMKSQPFQCLNHYRNYANLSRGVLQMVHSTEAASMWRNVIWFIVPKPWSRYWRIKEQRTRDRYKDPGIISLARSRRICWLGYVLCWEKTSLVFQAMKYTPWGRRPLGRPWLHCKDQVDNMRTFLDRNTSGNEATDPLRFEMP